MNRPKGKFLWFWLLILTVTSFMYGTMYLNEYYSTTYLLQLVLTAMATIVIAEFIRNRRSFWAGVAKIVFLLAVSAASLWFTLRFQNALSSRWVNVENRIRDMEYWWGSLNYHCQQVLQHSKLFGASETEYLTKPVCGDAYSMDYLHRYFINFLIQEYGLVLGIATAVLSVVFVWALIRGARRQLCKLDRSICMSCAVYFAIQLVIALPANFGLKWLPPYRIDFLGVSVGSWYTGILALSIYMAFYKAHKQMR